MPMPALACAQRQRWRRAPHGQPRRGVHVLMLLLLQVRGQAGVSQQRGRGAHGGGRGGGGRGTEVGEQQRVVVVDVHVLQLHVMGRAARVRRGVGGHPRLGAESVTEE
jgi:hypothetical protein